MPPFKDYWEQNRHILQFVGIICGVGALFLAIPEPSNSAAKDALSSIQFIWLIFIGLGVIMLLVSLFTYINQIQSLAEKKFGIAFITQGSPSFIIISILISFCINLWSYASTLYVRPLRWFEGIIFLAVMGVILFLTEFQLKKFKEKLGRPTEIILRALISSTLIMFAFSFQQIITAAEFYKLETLDWWKWLAVVIISIFSVILLIEAFLEYRKNNSTNGSLSTAEETEIVVPDL